MNGDDSTTLTNKRTFLDLMSAIADAPADRLGDTVAAAYHPEVRWSGSHPLDELDGADAIAAVVWGPMRDALPDLERRDTILLGGRSDDGDWVAAIGHYQGTFVRDWLGIPATGGVVDIRYGEFDQMVDGRIVRSHVLIDFLDLMRQAGVWPIAPSLGAEAMWPGPATQDGLLVGAQDPALSAARLELVRDMHRGLLVYDGKSLSSMDHARYWHPKMMWYGPSGIGTTRALKGFEDFHQVPFLKAFPDRAGAGHYAEIAEGEYVATGGWPSLTATHLGGDWLGLAPTGRTVAMRVMDFYRCADGLIRENWVPIDIIDILRQLGVDVFGRMHLRRGRVG